MDVKKAKAIVTEAATNIDWHNFGVVLANLGSDKKWGKFAGDKWVPDYAKAREDLTWAEKKLPELLQALGVLKEKKNDPDD